MKLVYFEFAVKTSYSLLRLIVQCTSCNFCYVLCDEKYLNLNHWAVIYDTRIYVQGICFWYPEN